MMKKQTVIIAIMLVMCVWVAAANKLVIYEESAAINRIVGDSPEELMVQLQEHTIEPSHASYVAKNYALHSSTIKKILKNTFEDNNYISSASWTLTGTILKAMSRWSNGELFILEDESGSLSPEDAEDWKKKFNTFSPFFIFNMERAGLYLPNSADNENSFIGQIGHYGTIIAPSDITENNFVKTLVCSLYSIRGNAEGYSYFKYTLARNRYYWGARNGGEGGGYWDNNDLNTFLHNLDDWETIKLAFKDIFDGDNALIGYSEKPNARVLMSYNLYGSSGRILLPYLHDWFNPSEYCSPEFASGDFGGFR